MNCGAIVTLDRIFSIFSVLPWLLSTAGNGSWPSWISNLRRRVNFHLRIVWFSVKQPWLYLLSTRQSIWEAGWWVISVLWYYWYIFLGKKFFILNMSSVIYTWFDEMSPEKYVFQLYVIVCWVEHISNGILNFNVRYLRIKLKLF